MTVVFSCPLHVERDLGINRAIHKGVFNNKAIINLLISNPFP